MAAIRTLTIHFNDDRPDTIMSGTDAFEMDAKHMFKTHKSVASWTFTHEGVEIVTVYRFEEKK